VVVGVGLGVLFSGKQNRDPRAEPRKKAEVKPKHVKRGEPRKFLSCRVAHFNQQAEYRLTETQGGGELVKVTTRIRRNGAQNSGETRILEKRKRTRRTERRGPGIKKSFGEAEARGALSLGDSKFHTIRGKAKNLKERMVSPARQRIYLEDGWKYVYEGPGAGS